MELLRLQLAASAISEGLRKARAGKTDDGLRLIEHGLAALRGLLSEVEAKQNKAA
jgi:hypothetical protein